MIAALLAGGDVAPHVSAVILDGGDEIFASDGDRVYDLASLTKPLCTAEVALRGDVDRGHPLLPRGVTLVHLLQHSSGWPAHRLFEGTRDRIVAAALAEPLVHEPGAVHVYSDIGFLALGAVLEAEGGARIDALWGGPLAWGRPGVEVNDENARRMGGVAPHAGLFGSARQVAACAMRWLDGTIPRASEAFTRRGPGSHALGWDTPSGEASSAGADAPADAVGHLGFTGTSIWMSPSRRRVAVLLTDRVAKGPDLTGIRALRRLFHQAAWTA